MFLLIFFLLTTATRSALVTSCYGVDKGSAECNWMFEQGYIDLEEHVREEVMKRRKDDKGFEYLEFPLKMNVMQGVYPVIWAELLKYGKDLKYGGQILEVEGGARFVICEKKPCPTPTPAKVPRVVEEKEEV